MSEWRYIDVSADEVSVGEVKWIHQVFGGVFALERLPHGAALFCDNLPDGGVRLYFSPKAAELATLVLGQSRTMPCEKPSKVHRQLVGSDDAAAVLGVAVDP